MKSVQLLVANVVFDVTDVAPIKYCCANRFKEATGWLDGWYKEIIRIRSTETKRFCHNFCAVVDMCGLYSCSKLWYWVTAINSFPNSNVSRVLS